MTWRIAWVSLLLLPLAAAPAPACSIPVFRYALERWKPSTYELLIFHHGPQPESGLALKRRLEQPGMTANLDIAFLDPAGKLDEDQKVLWSRQGKSPALPRAVLRYPESEAKAPDAWAGPLAADLGALLDSPARRQLVELLSSGASVVFVVLESGDRKVDQAALGLLKKELPGLEKTVKLPEPSDEGPQLLSAVPLRVSFPVLRVSRADPAERLFVRILVGSEAELEKAIGPIVFPVFGRGRALAGLCGKDLNAKELESVVTFLCGACSCRVKELNPGTDLLIAADWDGKIAGKSPDASPEKPLPRPPIPPGKEKSAAADEAEEPLATGRRWLWYALGGLAALGVLAGVLLRGRAAA
jgi:hypothetical protein